LCIIKCWNGVSTPQQQPEGESRVSEKKKFLLRLDEEMYAALEKWAADELRSVNAQIEFLLKDSVRKSGREKRSDTSDSMEKTV
jgi:hypothetical protein